MSRSLVRTFSRVELAPPRYLSLPTAGIDISASGVKAVVVRETLHGLEVSGHKEVRIPVGAQDSRMLLTNALVAVRKELGAIGANIAVPESHGHLFETRVTGTAASAWRAQVVQKLEQYVPLPQGDIEYDLVPLTRRGDTAQVIGVGYSRKAIASAAGDAQQAGFLVRAVESEIFALPRALLSPDSTETILIVDIGRSTTKLTIVTNRIPRAAATLALGGHPLTLAVQKYFGVTEEEARGIKETHGLVDTQDREFLAAMLATVSPIREQVAQYLESWQARSKEGTLREPVARVLLVGGHAALRGLPEYLAAGVRVPVERGNVFRNFASTRHWVPPLEYSQALAFGTAIGLALREYED